MAIATAANLVDALRKHRLLDAAQLDEAARLQTRWPDPRHLARELIRRGWLTPFQVNQIFQGKAAELVLGQYLLLERLGEGGMGQVFKAKHLHMDRIVALKVMRPEHMANPDAVRRFHREIRTAASLAHPNIVMAYDADQVGSSHFFVMEYVDGIDLGRLVKEAGPLPIPQACDYIRQAATGLQHAFERGMVHRDIKPANLLVTVPTGSSGTSANQPRQKGVVTVSLKKPVVKILDMGVARLDAVLDEASSIRNLTQEGKAVGTPDYMAPEQARNSSTADIRSDLYSLGCTFYYLLTARVPFPQGSGVEKLLKHQMDEPTPVEKLRPDLPAPVAAIVKKLMAKKPADRYQTPAEVANALLPYIGKTGRLAGNGEILPVPLAPSPPRYAVPVPGPASGRRGPGRGQRPKRRALAGAQALLQRLSDLLPADPQQRRLVLLLGILGLLSLGLIGLFMFLISLRRR
jgi:serine/threonine-protein kinase